MFIQEFDSDMVEDWIEDAAQNVIDNYDDSVSFNERVIDTCDRMIDEWRDYLILIAYYGPKEACVGGVDFEDSAYSKFEDAVYFRAKEMLEDEGYDVSDL